MILTRQLPIFFFLLAFVARADAQPPRYAPPTLPRTHPSPPSYQARTPFRVPSAQASNQAAIQRAMQQILLARAAQIRQYQLQRQRSLQQAQQRYLYRRNPVYQHNSWNGGQNYWSGRAGSGNYNRGNTAGYVWIPGTGGVTYGMR